MSLRVALLQNYYSSIFSLVSDFLTWELFDEHLLMKPDCLDHFPKLAAYHKQFMEEPRIKKFMESPKYFKGALRGKMASWGGEYPTLPPSLI